MRRSQCLLFALKRSYICCDIICMTVPLSLPQAGFTHPFFLLRKYCLKNPQPDVLFAVWLPSSTCSLPPLVLELLVYDPCVASAELSPVLEFFWKCILSPFTISKISRSFVRIIHTFKNILTFLLRLQKTRYVPMDEHFSDRLKEF